MLPMTYKIEYSRRRKCLALHVDHKGEIIARAPFGMPKRVIEAFILEKKGWLTQQQAKQEDRIVPFLELNGHSGYLFLFGERHSYNVIEGKRSQVFCENDHITIEAKTLLHAKKALGLYFKVRTQEEVNFYLEKYVGSINSTITSIGYREYKRRWGSCDGHNRLMFSSLLAALPREKIEYVVVHELAHLTQKHHQKAFWLEGERLLGDFKQRHKSMKI